MLVVIRNLSMSFRRLRPLYNLSLSSLSHIQPVFRPSQFANPSIYKDLRSSPSHGSNCILGVSTSSFGSYSTGTIIRCSDDASESHHEIKQDFSVDNSECDIEYDGCVQSAELEAIMGVLRPPEISSVEVKSKLEQCGVRPTPELVSTVLSRVRNNWEKAFTFFLWAGKQPGYKHSVRVYHSMISILGKVRKFDTAWSLIEEMRGSCNSPSLVSPHTLLIMIRKYCAIHDVGKAINAFYAHKKFKFDIGMEEFQNLLSALCRYKNVKEAEHLLFCNKGVFPLNTKSFNIILNGWCNIVGNLPEAKRIWKEMKVRGIAPDVYSFASMMSSYSKTGYLKAVFKLFDQMKAQSIEPDRKVYNAVIHALAKGRMVKEARILMKNMEEKGISPDTVTYNSLIMPLCRSRQCDDAREVFYEMIERKISPTVRTYHAFFRIIRTGQEAFELLHSMNEGGCHPDHDTYVMLIRKFCRWQQLDNVFKLWAEMSKNGLDPDRSSYIVLIHGLFLNGKLEESYKYYLEMKEKHLMPEPKIEEMLQAWIKGKQDAVRLITDSRGNSAAFSEHRKKSGLESQDGVGVRDFRRKPETRKITRERGFSLRDQ